MPPVSGGGICLAEKFKMIEPFDIAKMGHNSTEAIQALLKLKEERMLTEVIS
jgi:gamma-glutamyltranspeptidase/glutathione hydrolase